MNQKGFFFKMGLFICSAIFLSAQSQDGDRAYLDRLSRSAGNKIVLLGQWKADELIKWNNIINTDDLSGYDLTILGRNNAIWMLSFNYIADDGSRPNPNKENELSDFETWVLRQSGSPSSRWAAFDNSNRVITAGTEIPEIKVLDAAMVRFGIISNLRQLRAFLMEHPDHIDARTDLLKEVRRRALLAMPKDTNEELDEFNDLRNWGVLAREFDSAMNTDWISFNLDFLRVTEPQLERYSPLMKAVFRKHIGSVETVLREFPSNENLWDLWGWMAISLNDRPVFQFVRNLDSFNPCPSPKVAVWLTSLAKSLEDWESAIQMSKPGSVFDRIIMETRVTWSPNRFSSRLVSMGIPGFPEYSSYYPLLEALLKLGQAEEANNIFDELIRRMGTGVAQSAADIARSNNLEELAENWSKGIPTKQIPFCNPIEWGKPQIVIAASYDSSEYQQLRSVTNGMNLRWPIYTAGEAHKKTLAWTGDEFRYALVDGYGLVIEEGTEVPTRGELEEIVKRKDIKTISERALEFLKDYPDHIEAQIANGIESLLEAIYTIDMAKIGQELDPSQDDLIWGKAASAWAKVINHDKAIFAVPNFYAKKIDLHSPLMDSLSRRLLQKIETALHRSPSSDALWNLWLFWRNAGGNERDFESLLESVKPSPMEVKGSCPPPNVLEIYYNECKEKGEWPKIIKLLSEVWDREISQQVLENNSKEKLNEKPTLLFPQLGDNVGVPLIEALLNSGDRQEADGIFNAWLDCGGSFSTPSDLIELARNFNAERLANEWEEKVKKYQLSVVR